MDIGPETVLPVVEEEEAKVLSAMNVATLAISPRNARTWAVAAEEETDVLAAHQGDMEEDLPQGEARLVVTVETRPVISVEAHLVMPEVRQGHTAVLNTPDLLHEVDHAAILLREEAMVGLVLAVLREGLTAVVPRRHGVDLLLLTLIAVLQDLTAVALLHREVVGMPADLHLEVDRLPGETTVDLRPVVPQVEETTVVVSNPFVI